MEHETIVITIRDSDPLCVAVQMLTADSNKFRYLINELRYTELEMDDFDPDTVALFLTLLQDKQVENIEERHFRELHKMSVVFEVDWLTESCRKWLENKINSMDSNVESVEPVESVESVEPVESAELVESVVPVESAELVESVVPVESAELVESVVPVESAVPVVPVESAESVEYDNKLFLFEESRYILDKWEVDTYMELVIAKMDTMDNTAFISQYMRDFDQLKTEQLDLMLKLGSSKTAHKVFLEIVLKNVANKQLLDENIKHLLRSMDLSLCLEQNRELYDQLFETLPAMSELTNTDLKLILKLSVESARTAYSRKCMVLEDYEKKKIDYEKKDDKPDNAGWRDREYDQYEDYEDQELFEHEYDPYEDYEDRDLYETDSEYDPYED